MRLAMACLCLLLGAALIAVASHGLQASTPWQLWQSITSKIREA